MAQTPITPVETLEKDLYRASEVEVHYLDAQNERKEVRGSSAYIEMRLVVPQLDGQEVAVAFERVLLVTFSERLYCCSDCDDPHCEDDVVSRFAQWVAHYGRLVRLP